MDKRTTFSLPSYRSAATADRIEAQEFGPLCCQAAVRGAERERSKTLPATDADWEFIRHVQRQFKARLMWPKCAVKVCQELGYVDHGRRLCVRHWRELMRFAFAQRVDWLEIVDDFIAMYGKKLPPPREGWSPARYRRRLGGAS